MRIGELAKRSGVTRRTIRYYIERGLLPQPPQRGAYSDFDESYVQRLKLILQMKEERLSLREIRHRLAHMGLVDAPPTAPSPQLVLPFPPQEKAGPEAQAATAVQPGEGIFRSRFAAEAGLTPEQVDQLETLGVLESREGLFPSEALPVAQTVAQLLERGASEQDIAALVQSARREAELHRRLIASVDPANPVTRALQWQKQMQAASTLRSLLIQRWTGPEPEETDDR